MATEEKKTPVAATNDKSNAPTQTGVNTQSTKPVVGGETAKVDKDNDAAKKTTEPSNDVASKEVDPPETITAEQQAELDAFLDREDQRDPATTQPVNDSIRKLLKLLSGIPQDTPDEHPVWGAAGISLNLGDLRNIARALD